MTLADKGVSVRLLKAIVRYGQILTTQRYVDYRPIVIKYAAELI